MILTIKGALPKERPAALARHHGGGGNEASTPLPTRSALQKRARAHAAHAQPRRSSTATATTGPAAVGTDNVMMAMRAAMANHWEHSLDPAFELGFIRPMSPHCWVAWSLLLEPLQWRWAPNKGKPCFSTGLKPHMIVFTFIQQLLRCSPILPTLDRAVYLYPLCRVTFCWVKPKLALDSGAASTFDPVDHKCTRRGGPGLRLNIF